MEVKYHENLPELFEKELNYLGLEIKRKVECMMIEKKNIGCEEKIEIDFSQSPFDAIPFGILIAALNLNADFRGLHPLVSYHGNDLAYQFQSTLYALNIHSDFCDRSKLKIYNSTPLKIKERLGRFQIQSAIGIYLVPLVLIIKNIEFSTDENFKTHWELHRDLFRAFCIELTATSG